MTAKEITLRILGTLLLIEFILIPVFIIWNIWNTDFIPLYKILLSDLVAIIGTISIGGIIIKSSENE